MHATGSSLAGHYFEQIWEKSGCIMTRGPGGVKQIIFQGSKQVPEILQSKRGHARWHGR